MTNENVYYVFSISTTQLTNTEIELTVSLLQSTCGWFWNLFDDNKSCLSNDIIYDGGFNITYMTSTDDKIILNTYISDDFNLLININYYNYKYKLLLEINTVFEADEIDSNNLPHIKCIISKRIEKLFVLQLILDYVKKDGKKKRMTRKR